MVEENKFGNKLLVIFTLGVTAIIILIVVWRDTDRGEWKPTGDGITIVNSKTGEVRIARTGKVVSPQPTPVRQAYIPDQFGTAADPWAKFPDAKPDLRSGPAVGTAK